MKKILLTVIFALGLSILLTGCGGAPDGKYKVSTMLGAMSLKIDGNVMSAFGQSIEYESITIEEKNGVEYLVTKEKDGKIEKQKIISKP
ncbi:MAG: hypothetical protein U9N34_06905 [Candidatus Cloacimonadota bacterium]|nr:hypothetical protein [Candidatus Cloacimonadota bacterium]